MKNWNCKVVDLDLHKRHLDVQKFKQLWAHLEFYCKKVRNIISKKSFENFFRNARICEFSEDFSVEKLILYFLPFEPKSSCSDL